MDVLHHAVELVVDLLGGPDQTLGVLRHFQRGDADTACIDGLGRSDDHVLLAHEIGQSVVGGGHIGHLDVILDAVGDDLLGGVHLDVVLHGRGHDDISLDAPGLFAGEEGNAELVGIILDTVSAGIAHLEQIVHLFLAGGNALLVEDVAVGTGEGDDLGTQVHGLLADAPGDIAEACAGDGLALDVLALMLEDFLQIVHCAVAGGFRTGQGTAVGEALAGENAVLPDALQAAVLAEQVADLTAADAHVTGGNVDVRPDVAVQSGHKALAETHDLRIGLAGGVEIGAALAAADGKTGQTVLEDLLKAQELDDAGIDIGLEAQAALVGAESAVELAAVADVGVIIALVIHPDDAEGEHPLRLDHAVEQVSLHILGMGVDDRGNGGEDLLDGLHEFRLIAMLFLDIVDDALDICIHNDTISFYVREAVSLRVLCAQLRAMDFKL